MGESLEFIHLQEVVEGLPQGPKHHAVVPALIKGTHVAYDALFIVWVSLVDSLDDVSLDLG